MTVFGWLQELFDGDTPEIMTVDGFDDCIIGLTRGFGDKYRVVYDREKVVQKLVDRDGMTIEDAEEFFEFNIIGAYMSESDPIYLVATAPKLSESIQEE